MFIGSGVVGIARYILYAALIELCCVRSRTSDRNHGWIEGDGGFQMEKLRREELSVRVKSLDLMPTIERRHVAYDAHSIGGYDVMVWLRVHG